jgi:hypothetical protein
MTLSRAETIKCAVAGRRKDNALIRALMRRSDTTTVNWEFFRSSSDDSKASPEIL